MIILFFEIIIYIFFTIHAFMKVCKALRVFMEKALYKLYVILLSESNIKGIQYQSHKFITFLV